jgi:hypothetical protein
VAAADVVAVVVVEIDTHDVIPDRARRAAIKERESRLKAAISF